MKFQYHDLYDQQFERLTVEICAELLGMGAQPFSTGKDGGRDARFQGTAQCFPSASSPHVGKFVIQAKHTEHPFARFSDSDFASCEPSSTLSNELKRLKKLVASNELEHYMLFANRRLAGTSDENIRKRILAETQIKSVELFGVERIDFVLDRYPAIVDRLQISQVNGPLRVTSEDLAEVIVNFAEQKDGMAEARRDLQLFRTTFKKKNELNGLSEEFAVLIKHRYLKDFEQVKQFLANPANEELQERYSEAAVEFDEQIMAHRHDFPSLDRALVYIQELLFKRDGLLAKNKRLTKLVIYYMYWNCDIGKTEEMC